MASGRIIMCAALVLGLTGALAAQARNPVKSPQPAAPKTAFKPASAPAAANAPAESAPAPGPHAVLRATSRPLPQPQSPGGRITLGQAALLGVVEGITEYLPVSSTGHLILAGNYMGLTHQTQERGLIGHKLDKVPAIDAFEIVIQAGAILAVLGLYRKRVGQMIQGLRGKSDPGFRLFSLLFVAFVPAAIVGYLFHKPIEEQLFGPLPVAIALAVGGVAMIAAEQFVKRRRAACAADCSRPAEQCGRLAARPVSDIEHVRFWQALVIGLAQCLAMWPGTSRSMVTIVAAMLVGLDILAAAEFSFLLALPTLGAATVYSGYKAHHALLESAGWDGLIVGLAVSAVTAALAVKLFVAWLTRHGLTPFGVYRILLAAALLWYFAR